MKTNQLITVIAPVHNCEKGINRCISGIKQQTYKNIEVFVINDGSTDKTKEIVEKSIINNKRFHLINQENKGVSLA